MKIRIFILCLIVLAIFLWFFLRSKEASSHVNTSVVSVTNQIAKESDSLEPSPSPRPSPEMFEAMKQRHTPEASNELRQKMIKDWQMPLNFYGEVVDENMNPVEGAEITFHWMETMSNAGSRTITVTSDTNGRFSLEGEKGPSLSVSVSKTGYYSSRNNMPGFSYGDLSSGKNTSSFLNPVIFHLQKKRDGADLIQKDFPPGMGQIWQLHHDGTPIELDLLNGSLKVNGNGQLKLELKRDLSNPNANKFDWKLQMTMRGGGILPTADEFAFQAPESGYQSSIVIDMPATNQDWLGELRTKYYIQLPNGNYGRIDLYFLAYNGVFTIHSAINPTGSRNLEPK